MVTYDDEKAHVLDVSSKIRLFAGTGGQSLPAFGRLASNAESGLGHESAGKQPYVAGAKCGQESEAGVTSASDPIKLGVAWLVWACLIRHAKETK